MDGPEAGVIYIVESILGVFGVNNDSEIVEKTLYPADPKQIAAALNRQREGELTREVVETVDRLMQRGFRKFVFSSGAMANAVRRCWGVEIEVRAETTAGNYLRDNLEELSIELGVVERASQLLSLSHEVSVIMARRAVGRALSEREAMVTQTVHVLGELDKSLNALSSRLREWYGLHFPELGRLLDDHGDYARVVSDLGERDCLETRALSELGLPRVKAEEVSMAARTSMGAMVEKGDIDLVRQFASHVLGLYLCRTALEEHLSALAEETTPNLAEVAGPVLAARLVEKAGGLRKLAMMPSSTVQLLGAEKAMFRALKSGSKPPKHGLIFQHPFVHSSPRRMRGRSARFLAAKLSIAARADAFSGAPLGHQLRKELDSRMERTRSRMR